MSVQPARRVRGPSRFREKDVVRVIKAARKANISIAAVEISVDGAIRIVPGTPPPMPTSERNPFDDD